MADKIKRKSPECPYCGFVFSDDRKYTELWSQAEGDFKRYQCPHCSNVFGYEQFWIGKHEVDTRHSTYKLQKFEEELGYIVL